MAHMPKTPRRSLRSYLRTAPVIVVPFSDTEILADTEAGATSHSSTTVYRLGKLPRHAAEMPRWETHLHGLLDFAVKAVLIGLLLVAAAAGIVMMMPKV